MKTMSITAATIVLETLDLWRRNSTNILEGQTDGHELCLSIYAVFFLGP